MSNVSLLIFDSVRNNVAGGTAYVYETGTTTQVDAFSDEAGNHSLGQPIVCTWNGSVPAYIARGQTVDVAWDNSFIVHQTIAPDPTPGGTIRSLRYTGDPTDLNTLAFLYGPGGGAVAPFTFADLTLDHDTIGALVATEAPLLVLPKGYYAGTISFQSPTLTVGGDASDICMFSFSVQVGYLDSTDSLQSVGVVTTGTAISSVVGNSPLSIPISFESGETDFSTLGITEHGFAGLGQFQAQMASLVTGSEPSSGESIQLGGFEIYLQHLGDKA